MSLNPPTGVPSMMLSGGGVGGGNTMFALLPLIGYLGLGYFNVLGGFIPWFGVSVAASAWIGQFLGNMLAGTPMSKGYIGSNMALGAIIWGVVTGFTGSIFYGMLASLLFLYASGMSKEFS